LEAVREEVIGEMVAMYRRQIPFRSFAVQAVQWSAAHFPTALASGSPRRLVDIVIQAEELQGCFEEVLVADEVGPGKPDPAVYLETARRLGIAPEACVCLEDSPNGVLSGHRAGMFVINIPDPRYPLTTEQAANADLVLASLGDFTAATIAQLENLPRAASAS
jgi:beta-phosphoglucomutase-like phosphatase (HAD superfamily)